MITELYGNYGCYLGETSVKLVVSHADELTEGMLHDKVMSQYLYPMAKEETEGWIGSSGFELGECDCEEEKEDDVEYECNCDRSDEEVQLVEEACDYEVHPWDEEKWSGQFVGSIEGNTVHIEVG